MSSDFAVGAWVSILSLKGSWGVSCTHGIFLVICIDLVESIHFSDAHNIFPSYCLLLAIFDLEVGDRNIQGFSLSAL